MLTELFNYNLPKELIAQYSVEPRDLSRLLVLDRVSGSRRHLIMQDLPSLLRPGDLLVLNNTKVFKARLSADLNGRSHEIFLLRCVEYGGKFSEWLVLIRGARKFSLGAEFHIGSMPAKVILRHDDNSGALKIEIGASQQLVLDYCEKHGHIPVPNYVGNEPTKLEDYQTVYAKITGSVAAPTAGFHFTRRLLDELERMGVEKTFVTLHVGIGTFQPIKTDVLEDHKMHSEFVELSSETVECISRAKFEGRRVIAVGTTTVRVLEGVAATKGCLEPYVGDVNLFIKPGFEFKVIDGLITNFHLPKSTLLALVSAFAGRENVLEAYREAVETKYRFYSFGDAMFIF